MTDKRHLRDRFRDRLSEYIDGRLGPEEEALMEAHLERSEACLRTLVQLEAVVERAGEAGPREPTTDLWPGIAARIGIAGDAAADAGAAAGAASTGTASAASPEPEVADGRWPWRGLRTARGMARFAPQLAAAVALVWLSAGLAWMAGAGSAGQDGAAATGPGVEFPSLLPPTARQISTGDDAATTAEDYADLERALFDSDRPLPPQTVARIRRALVTIDRAIEDARAALLEVPDNPYLQEHMRNTMQRKSEFLAQAVRLAASD